MTTTIQSVDHALIEPRIRELERVVDDLIGCYESIARETSRRHEAVRRALPEEVEASIAAEGQLVAEIAKIEERRAALVRQIALALGSDAGARTTITWIGERLGGSLGERLLEKGESFRQRLSAINKENEVVRRALTLLAAHMEGLWRQAASVLNHAKTYGRMGAVDPGPRVVSAIDLTS